MNNSEFLKHSKLWDRSGIVIAALCAIHCLLLPVILLAVPTVQAFLNNSWLETSILALGVLIGSVSFITSYQKHRQPYPMMVGFLGVFFLASHLFFFTDGAPHWKLSSWLALDPLMLLGGCLLMSGHFWNIHACHCFCDHSCSHHDHDKEPLTKDIS